MTRWPARCGRRATQQTARAFASGTGRLCTADGNEFPDGTEVWVRFPGSAAESKNPREEWPWLAGVVIEWCGPDEWQVQVTAREVATLEDGEPGPGGDADEDLWHPLAFRDSSEIRREDDKIAQARTDDPPTCLPGPGWRLLFAARHLRGDGGRSYCAAMPSATRR